MRLPEKGSTMSRCVFAYRQSWHLQTPWNFLAYFRYDRSFTVWRFPLALRALLYAYNGVYSLGGCRCGLLKQNYWWNSLLGQLPAEGFHRTKRRNATHRKSSGLGLELQDTTPLIFPRPDPEPEAIEPLKVGKAKLTGDSPANGLGLGL